MSAAVAPVPTGNDLACVAGKKYVIARKNTDSLENGWEFCDKDYLAPVIDLSFKRETSDQLSSKKIDISEGGTGERGTGERRSSVVSVMWRILAWILATVIIIGVALGLGTLLRPSEYSGETWEHTVTSGESMWSLAASLDSVRPLEDLVEDIRILNCLSDATLHVGQVIILPAE